jgi:hypothetical protein
MTQTMEATRFERMGGVDVITGFTLTEEDKFDNDEVVVFQSQFRFTDVDVHPDFTVQDPFTISTPIPNGTPVQVDDRPTINYEWLNGKIEKSINPTAVANLEANAFRAGSSPGRGVWLAVGLGLVMLGIAIWHGRRLQAGRGA